MKVKMLISCNGASNPEGSVSMVYKRDEIYDMSQDWQKKIADNLISADLAMEIKVETVENKIVKEDKKEDKKKEKKKGKFTL
tara:strand:- start:212 stop:457 length:246 start_codon:yes stop_codon:yes gene_type:complete